MHLKSEQQGYAVSDERQTPHGSQFGHLPALPIEGETRVQVKTVFFS
jgi:hypothetical protein